MANYVRLNNIQHGSLKVVSHYSSEMGDGKATVMTFPSEFADVQREYPILLRRDPDTSDYQAVALLGIQKDENLFLREGDDGNGWSAAYVPAIVARGPFIIGYQKQSGDAERESEPMIYVDLDSRKLSESEGESLFLQFGGNSPYLEYISAVLRTIHEGTEVGRAMFRVFDELELIEPVIINIDLKNGDKHQLAGYYTISEEKLAALSGDSLWALNQSGYLQGAFLMISSLPNIKKLIDMKNALM